VSVKDEIKETSPRLYGMAVHRCVLYAVNLCLIPVVTIIAAVADEDSVLQKLHFRIRSLVWKRRLQSMGCNSRIYRDVIIHCPECVSIGNNVAIAEFVHMWGKGGIRICDNVIIAAHSVLTSVTHDKYSTPFGSRNIYGNILIEEDVWIGSNAVILPDVKIGKHSIVGAGSVVTKSVPEYSIVAGVPAHIVGRTDKLTRHVE